MRRYFSRFGKQLHYKKGSGMNRQPGIFSRFYKHNKIEDLMVMDDEEVLQRIDKYLEQYIKSYQKRNPGKDLKDIELLTLNDIRNKRDKSVSKKPKISGRRTYE